METHKITIKQLAEDDRPREKMLAKGVNALSNAELLAILIGSGSSNESAVQLSQRILASAENNLEQLGKYSIQDLIKSFKGIGEAKAITIKAAIELGKRRAASASIKRDVITQSNDVFVIMQGYLGDLPHEEMWMVMLNRSNKIIGKTKISQGGVSQTSVDVRIVLKEAIVSLASGIIILHNHPSGKLLASTEDKQITTRIKEACTLLDIKLLDHLIIAGNEYISFADKGML